MDIARPSNARRKRLKRLACGAAALVAVLLITLGVSRLKPAAPGVERATLWIDTVKRGPLVREVRGSGTLVPEDIRWIPATTQGMVDRILLRPGSAVTADSVVLELVNPQLDQELQARAARIDRYGQGESRQSVPWIRTVCRPSRSGTAGGSSGTWPPWSTT